MSERERYPIDPETCMRYVRGEYVPSNSHGHEDRIRAEAVRLIAAGAAAERESEVGR